MSRKLIIFIIVLSVIIPFTFSSWGVTESSEARYAEISREMYVSGNYVHPKLLGINHYHKPPLTYYITSAGYFLFGVNEYGARFFLVIALLLQLFFVYKIAAQLFKNKELSLAAMLLYLSYPIVQIATKNLTTDSYLTTFIFAGIYFFIEYRQQQRALFIYLFYICCGLAFLTKGPVGVMPSGTFAIAYVRFFKNDKKFSVHHLTAIIAGLVIAASWFIILLLRNEKLLDYFIGHQIVDRVSSNNFDRSKPFWYYFLTMPLIGLPTIVLFIHYVVQSFQKKRTSNALSKVLLISFVLCFIVFSLSSSKLILYVLPLYLFIALVSVRQLTLATPKQIVLYKKITLYFFTVLFTALLVMPFAGINFVFPKLPLMLLGAAGLLVIFYLNKTMATQSIMSTPVIAAAGMIVLTCAFPFIMSANEIKINSVKPLAAIIKEKTNSDTGKIVVYNYLLPSLAFYSNSEVITLNNGNNTTNREVQFEQQDSKYKQTYFRIGKDSVSVFAKTLSKQMHASIVVRVKDPLPDSLYYLRANLPDSIVADKWIIYY